jgi:plasmid stabilization system protein ParE
MTSQPDVSRHGISKSFYATRVLRKLSSWPDADRPLGQRQGGPASNFSISRRAQSGRANDFIRRIDENFKNLARFPFIGRERSHLAPGLRCLIAGLHLIFYTVDRDEIAIVRVIDGRMDVDEEFQR